MKKMQVVGGLGGESTELVSMVGDMHSESFLGGV